MMEEKRDAPKAGWWHSFGAGSVSLRDAAAREIERERAERLCLINERRGVPRLAVALGVGLTVIAFLAALALLGSMIG
jgi:hypothetical protein